MKYVAFSIRGFCVDPKQSIMINIIIAELTSIMNALRYYCYEQESIS